MKLRETTATTEKVWLEKHYGESLVINWAGYSWVLGAGQSDWLYPYRDLDSPQALWVLTVNRGLGYIGLELLNGSYEPTASPYQPRDVDGLTVYLPSWDIFSQNPDDSYGLKPDGLSLLEMAPYNAIRFMAQWWQ